MVTDFLDTAILLNSGRNCLRYIVKAYNIREIFIPFYICPVIWQELRKENVKIKFYHIDQNFMPLETFPLDAYILYPNYFGICSKQVEFLAQRYENLILDNALAFFSEQEGLATFYSPRKFFDINDGGILFVDKKLPDNFEQDEDRFCEINDYNSFCKNELSIDNQPIKKMSLKTYATLKQINFAQEKQKRIKMFFSFHKYFAKNNSLKINLTEKDIPYQYPLLSCNVEKIVDFFDKNNIYLIKYGTNLPKYFPEYNFVKNLLLIPMNENNLNLILDYVANS